jgi:hypothetical protein
MKRCSRCRYEKDENEFYKDKRSTDGLNCACKPCVNKINKEWGNKNQEIRKKISQNAHERNREKEREYAREYARKLREENYKKYREAKDKWDRENPEKAKSVRRKAVKKWTEKNYDRVKRTNEEWRIQNPEKVKEYARKGAKISRIKWPERNAARKMVSGALTLGILIRPTTCSLCLKECKPEGHHPDYSKPLEVIWLCRGCHNKEHGKVIPEIRYNPI